MTSGWKAHRPAGRSHMMDIAKTLMIAGAVLILFGAGLYFFGKIPGVGKLPGDIFIKKDNFTFYFPLTTCIILSLLFSLLIMLWNRR